ncbi:10149_t:CDS:1 [Paraglomus brasilianum]|uniref:10149_t:CDS:1 n=1 Tax=Paraglomus brasilianum TaxID=144538 RepID=A0A9N8ZJV7_9GLOM|nr:10149_t:CDS:1 [Paraglomus brasilianum]
MSIKVLILGAGYGTRLQRDIRADPTHAYSHLLGVPKALLPVGNYDALISSWLDVLTAAGIDSRSDLYIVTNAMNYDAFITWTKRHNIPADHICSDGTTANENRLGAIADIEYAIKYFKLDSDILIIAGDLLFYRNFKLSDMLIRFSSLSDNDCLTVTYTIPDEFTKRYGIALIDESLNNLITHFLEKPDPEETASREACPCFYLLKKNAVSLISEFLKESEKKGEALEQRDAPGKFLAWAINEGKCKFYAENINGRIDVGGLNSYVEALKYFE